MVACPDLIFSYSSRRTYHLNTRFSVSPFYLRYFLDAAMAENIKIKIKKKKKRVPLPQKPPKVIASKKTYDRKKEKKVIKSGEVNSK